MSCVPPSEPTGTNPHGCHQGPWHRPRSALSLLSSAVAALRPWPSPTRASPPGRGEGGASRGSAWFAWGEGHRRRGTVWALLCRGSLRCPTPPGRVAQHRKHCSGPESSPKLVHELSCVSGCLAAGQRCCTCTHTRAHSSHNHTQAPHQLLAEQTRGQGTRSTGVTEPVPQGDVTQAFR